MEENQNQKANPQEKTKKAVVGYMLFELGAQFAVIMAIPLLGFIYLGKWLESKYHSKLFVVAGILLALTLSGYLIYKKIDEIKKLMK